MRHERVVSATPEDAVAAMLAAPAAPDRAVRALLRLRGLHAPGTVAQMFAGMRFQVLHESATEVVVGGSGTPWRPGGGIRPFAADDPGSVRIAVEISATSIPGGGCALATETRIAACDTVARRAFRRYWLLVRPFSGLIRGRWLAAAARELARK
jgi:hypothetical protein